MNNCSQKLFVLLLVGCWVLFSVSAARAFVRNIPDENAHVASTSNAGDGIHSAQTRQRPEDGSGDSEGNRAAMDAARRMLPFIFDSVQTSVGGSMDKTNISGTPSGSFRDDGWKGLLNLSMIGERAIPWIGTLELNVDVRGVNDARVRPDPSLELRGIYGRVFRESDYELRLGKVSASFSDFSLSSGSDLGARFDKQLDWFGIDRLRAYAGRDRRERANQFRRFNGGIRLEGSMDGWFPTYGLNYARTWDDVDSIDDPSARPARAVENEVFSLDGVLELAPGWELEGEWAYARTDTGTRNPTRPLEDWALHIQTDYRFSPSKVWRNLHWNARYEEVRPEFRSSSGGGSPDRRSLTTGLSGEFDRAETDEFPTLRWEYGFQFREDGLEDLVKRSSGTTGHRFQLQFDPFRTALSGGSGWMTSFWENLTGSASYRLQEVDTSDTQIQRRTVNRDYSLSTRVDNHDLSTFYRYRINRDLTLGENGRRVRSYGLRYEVEDWEWKFTKIGTIENEVSLAFDRNEDQTGDGTGGSDRSSWSLGARQVHAGGWETNLTWSRSDTDHPGTRDDVVKTRWSLSLTRSSLLGDRGQFSLSYRAKDTDREMSSNDRQETELRADVELSF